jgi:hypothetical protein
MASDGRVVPKEINTAGDASVDWLLYGESMKRGSPPTCDPSLCNPLVFPWPHTHLSTASWLIIPLSPAAN